MSEKPVAKLGRAGWLHAKQARVVMWALLNAGGNARFVGGAVRDGLLKREVKDVDIATTLSPEAVIDALEKKRIKVFPIGIKHGTVLAFCAGSTFEITTLREDVETDGRRAKVSFTTDWKTDAARRDFTINALYADMKGNVYDYFGGVEDLQAKRVRFIGEPKDRIQEDALRILRFFRFLATHGKGEPDTAALAACIELRENLKLLSRERVRDELLKTLGAGRSTNAVRLMVENGIMQVIAPDMCDVEELGRVEHLERRFNQRDGLRCMVSLLPKNKDNVHKALRELRLPNKKIARGLDMVKNGPIPEADMDEDKARAMLYGLGRQAFVDRLILYAPADAKLTPIFHIVKNWQPPTFPITGDDILERKLAQGPKVGSLLQKLEHAWVESNFSLSREELLALAEES